MASGVLPICLGEATKLAQFLLDADKEYEATVCFGVETDTYDAQGAVTARADASAVTAERVGDALAAFRGAVCQIPPRYSALKHKGRALYDYARAGQPVDAPERTVVIHELSLGDWAGPGAVALRVRCSKGTYIRSLAFDLGRALGVGAHLTGLRRTRSGPFCLDEAHPLSAAATAPLVALPAALGHLPALRAGPDAVRDIVHGKRIPCAALAPEDGAGPVARDRPRCLVLRPDGSLLAVVDRQENDDTWRAVRVFN
jgi:tRNA pseudouridine55 synthase